MNQQPSVGRVVHYVSHGTPPRADGSQAFTAQCRAAVITEVDPEEPNRVGLLVQNPTGLFFHPLAAGGSTFHDGAAVPGAPDCPTPHEDGPFRYCACGWMEAHYTGGSWHWPERV
jgi:hypothetical protein